jgi:prepilin-type processing-associated H-X9-DG protein
VLGSPNLLARGVHYNGAHGGIGRNEPNARSRQIERPAHVLFVDGHKIRDYFITYG